MKPCKEDEQELNPVKRMNRKEPCKDDKQNEIL